MSMRGQQRRLLPRPTVFLTSLSPATTSRSFMAQRFRCAIAASSTRRFLVEGWGACTGKCGMWDLGFPRTPRRARRHAPSGAPTAAQRIIFSLKFPPRPDDRPANASTSSSTRVGHETPQRHRRGPPLPSTGIVQPPLSGRLSPRRPAIPPAFTPRSVDSGKMTERQFPRRHPARKIPSP